MSVNSAQKEEELLRRRDPRVPYQKTIMYKGRRASGAQGVVSNLSEGGLYLLAAERVSPGTELVFYLPIEDGKREKLCILSGRVIRADTPVDSQFRGHGVQFTEELSQSTRSQLRSFISIRTTLPLRDSTPPASSASLGRIALKTVPATKAERPERTPAPVKFERTDPAKRGMKAKKKKPSGANGMALVLLLFCFGIASIVGFSLYKHLKWEAQISKYVPMSKIDKTDDRLTGMVSPDWVQLDLNDRKEQLKQLGDHLLQQKIYTVVLTDLSGKTVATIMKNPNQLKNFGVRVWN